MSTIDWTITVFAAIGATCTILAICWLLAGIWVKVFPR